jgi:Cys-tRNA(Pro)/Cys-tRNA(Cys) deacylase
MTKKLNSLRFLEAQGIAYEEIRFPETIHSAKDVADYLGLSASQVYKTLVVLAPQGKPMLVMIAGDREIQLKRLAHALGEKKLRMATQKEAEALTGLKIGGISALALHHRGFRVYLDRAAAALEELLVSAGHRGADVRLRVVDLIRITGAVFTDATTPETGENPTRSKGIQSTP